VLLRVGDDEGEAGLGEDVEAEVTAAFGPFVVLFGQDRADETDQGVTVGEDPDDVGAAADLPVQTLLYPALVGGSSPIGWELVNDRDGRGDR